MSFASRNRLFAAFVLFTCWLIGGYSVVHAQTQTIPKYDHVVIVFEENHAFSQIIGDTTDNPYINQLASTGVSLTGMFAETHPSQPNYVAFFTGGTQGVTDDTCPEPSSALNPASNNLGAQLLAAGFTFIGYADDMPSNGFTGCTSGEYARKHDPWVNFTNIPATDSLVFQGNFPTDFTTLPTFSFVTPDLLDDMHDGTQNEADVWLQNNLGAYATWATTHNSLLVVTWDEDNDTGSSDNQIATIFYGANLIPGQYSTTYNHFNLLATFEAMYGLPNLGTTPMTGMWSTAPSFTLSDSPASLSITQGSNGTSTIKVNPVNGFTGSVTLAASGLPNGVTAAFATNPTTGTSVVTLTASSTATTGNSTLTITGTSGSLTSTATIALTVNAPAVPSFTLSDSPSSLSVTQGNSGSSTITVDPTNGFTGSVTLAASGLPSGVTAAFATNPTTGTSVMTLTASSTATTGNSTVTIAGTSGNLTSTTPLALTVSAPAVPSFTLTESSASQTVTQGSSNTNTITVHPVNGFTGSVTLEASGLPSGVTASFSTNPTASSSMLTLTASKTANTGKVTVNIGGTSGSLTANATLVVTVKARR